MNEDLRSFNLLYATYQRRFVCFAQSYVRDLPVAEDITLEALMYYWENRNIIDHTENIPAYILTMIKHKCLNHLRHQQICEDYSESVRDYYAWELATRITSLQACEPHELFAVEIEELVRQTLEQLPETTRRIFWMSRYEHKAYKEIAVQMDMTVKGVEFHINKALRELQSQLKDYYPLFPLFFLPFH